MEQLRSARDALERERDDAEAGRADAAAALVSAEERLADESDRRDAAEREAASARTAEMELKRQWSALDASHTRVQGELGTARVELERAQTELSEQSSAVQAARDAQKELTLVVAEKDRLLRDQRSEAELDRAVLEKQVDELRKRLAARDKDVELAQGRTKTVEGIVEGLREQVARWEKVAHAKEEDVDAIKREIDDARRDKEKGIVDVQRELVRMSALAREAVTLAGRMRDENNNIAHILNTPPSSKGDASAAELDKAVQVPSPASQEDAPPPPLDYASGDLDELLHVLQAYSHDSLTDAVKNKVDSLTSVTKKWVKEAKGYRERAHRAASGASDKIAFRKCVSLCKSVYPQLALTVLGLASQLRQGRPGVVPPDAQLGRARLGRLQRQLPTPLPQRDGRRRRADEDARVDRRSHHVLDREGRRRQGALERPRLWGWDAADPVRYCAGPGNQPVSPCCRDQVLHARGRAMEQQGQFASASPLGRRQGSQQQRPQVELARQGARLARIAHVRLCGAHRPLDESRVCSWRVGHPRRQADTVVAVVDAQGPPQCLRRRSPPAERNRSCEERVHDR